MSDPSAAFFVSGAIPLILIGAVYERGARRRATIERPVSTVRRAMFVTGIVSFLLSIEWPFADWEHELFSAHQIGMLVARLIAPILIVASRPAGLLIAGLPRPVRRGLLKPGLSHPVIRRAWRVVATPPVTLALYVATLYFWEIPALQADAIGQPAAGLAMHFSLLLTGLLFWSRVFERRPAPHAPAHGWRLMMILIAVLSQVLLGAYLTVKGAIYYPAYAPGQHLAAMPAILDEQTTPLNQVMNLEVGQTLMLGANPDSKIELRCRGVPLLTGRMGRVGSSVAVRVDEAIERTDASRAL